ncbi:MAG: flavodoxin family protein [Lachnospiraceae bacterium]|nr:flavodoxin family protein [Lachnospiraceae bacterium]
MKVLLVNGSRRENGCTYTALTEIEKELKAGGIDTEILNAGNMAAKGNVDEAVKQAAEIMKTADGMIVGSPVYYASPSGEIMMFLDRLFSSAGADLRCKPAAAIASARRAGTTATLDVLNKYFLYNEMPLIASRYWNMVHGSKPEDVLKDEEGVQIMHTLGRNMVWALKSIEAGRAAGVEQPVTEEKVYTSFIR